MDGQPTKPDPRMAWQIEPEATSFLVVCPGDAPTVDVAEHVASTLGGHVVGVMPDPAPALWNALLETDAGTLAMWGEPTEFAAGDVEQIDGLPERGYFVGIQGVLAADDPLSSFHGLVRAAVAAVGHTPGLIDVTTSRWFVRDMLDAWWPEDSVEPPAEVLWSTAAAARPPAPGQDPMFWLHTRGLARCGRPELEMLEVPSAEMQVAARVLGIATELLVNECDVLDRLELGADLSVALRDPKDVVPQISFSVSDAERYRAEQLAGKSSRVICAIDDVSYPRELLGRFKGGYVGVYRTERAGARVQALAQRYWPALLAAAARIGDADSGVSIEVEARFEVAGSRETREHLWIRVERADGNRINGRVLTPPDNVLVPADGLVWIDPARVTNWQVRTENAGYEPGDGRELERAMGLRS